MNKQIISINLDGTYFGSKELNLDDNLISIRNKINKNLDDINYIFVDKYEKEIEFGDEEGYTLNDIHKDKAIYLRKVYENEKE